jgi:ELWxxDGT repeat protein
MKNHLFLCFLALLLAASYPIQAQVQLVAHPNQDTTRMDAIYSTFFEFKGKVFFSARDNIGNALYCTDGTSDGTHFITRDLDPQAFISCGEWLYIYGSKAQYHIPWWNSFGQYAIWRMRADFSECQKLADLYKPYDMSPHSFLWWSANDRLFFSWRGGLSWIDNTSGEVIKVFQGLDNAGKLEDYYLVNGVLANDGMFFLTTRNSAPCFYYTDLTKEGTVYLATIKTKGSSIPMDNMFMFNDKCYVLHVEDTIQLWESDGTPAGTSLLWQNTNYPVNQSAPYISSLTEYNAELIFDIPEVVNDTLWHSIYTCSTDGVKLLQRYFTGYYNINFIKNPDGLYAFVINPQKPNQLEVWFKDDTSYRKLTTIGLPAAIRYVKKWNDDKFIILADKLYIFDYQYSNQQFSTGAFGNPLYPTSLGVFFNVTINQQVLDPWVLKTDPPSCQPITKLISDLKYGSISNLTPVGDQLYFVADSKEFGTEVWVTGGQAATTHLVRNINESGNASPFAMVPLSDKIAFTMMGSNSYDHMDQYGFSGLWMSDGTDDGTIKLEDLMIREDDNRGSKVVWKDKIYFVGKSKSTADEDWRLYVSNGKPGEARIFDEQFTGLHFTEVHSLTAANDHLFFIADGGKNGTELWVTDGTEAGTFSIDNLTVDREYLQNTEGPKLLASGSRLFVTRDKRDDDPQKMASNREIWVTDGTADGSKCFADFVDNRNLTFQKFLGIHKGNLVYTYCTPASGLELWYSGGDRSNTVQLTGLHDIHSNNDKQFAEGVALGDQFFFTAFTEENGSELWVTDGTVAGTHIFLELAHGQQSTYPKALTVVGNKLFFFVECEGIDQPLWMTDGTIEGTEPLPWDFTHLNSFRQTLYWKNTLYFIASHPDSGQGLYRYNLDGILGTGTIEKPDQVSVLTLYPNPATDYLRINLSGQFPIHSLGKLITAEGRVVKNIILENGTMILPVKELPAGIYYIQVEGQTRVFIKK